MIEFGDAGISAVLEPRTAGSATTAFAGFLGDAAFETRRSDWRGRFYRHMGMNEMHRHANTMQINFFWWSDLKC